MLGVPEGATAVVLNNERKRVTVYVIARVTHVMPNGRKVSGYRVHGDLGAFTVPGWDVLEYKGIVT